VRPLYDSGRYAEAADTGRELIEARPDQGYLYYNVACCESLAGRTVDAIEHIRQAIGMWEGCRDMAKEDSDFERSGTSPLSRNWSAARSKLTGAIRGTVARANFFRRAARWLQHRVVGERPSPDGS